MFLPERRPDEDWLGIVIAIPEPWNIQITQMRQELGEPMATKIAPHITLMPPMPIHIDQRELVFEHLVDLAQKYQPFRVTLVGTDTFQPVSPVSFLKVEQGADVCAQIAEDIQSGPLDYTLRFPYHPHVTLAQGLPDEALNKALELGKSFEASWMVQGFRVDRVESDGSYVSTALFDFSSTLL